MNESPPQDARAPSKSAASDYVALLARWLLGALFVYLGLTKALHPVEFLKLVRQYEMVSSPVLLNSIAGALPWFEVFCGLLLVAGVAVRGSALISLLMLAPFTLVILRRALALSAAKAVPFCTVAFDCGCGTGEVIACHKLVENCALILLSIWLMTGRGRSLSLRFSLFKTAQREFVRA
jgi:uncharacterized membrane protein YphA (DoxX/SURF4 family)